MKTYNSTQQNSSRFGNHRRSAFARAASRSAFGNRWADPDNDNFKDRDPGERRSVVMYPETFHQIGDVAADVLRNLIHANDNDEAA